MHARNWLIAAALFVPAAVQAATATRTSSFEYDPASGLPTKEVIEPDNSNLCLVTTYKYNAFGNKEMVTTRNCGVTGDPTGVGTGGEAIVPTGDAVFVMRTSSAAYAAGSVVIGGTTYSWSAGQFLTTSTNAINHSETKEYDPRFGAPTKLTDPNSLVTTWSYDGFGRKTLETRPDGNKTEWAYLFCSGVNGGTHACPTHGKYLVRATPKDAAGVQNGPISKIYYDALNREIRSETQGFSGTLVLKDTAHDLLGRVQSVSRPYYAAQGIFLTTFTYDILGRVATETQPSTTSGTIRTTTGYNGLITTVTVSNNGTGTNLPLGLTQTRTTRKNSQGHVDQVTDALGNIITYTYDPFGSLLTTNAGGVVTTLTYDLRGRKTAMADPNMGNWTYGYNALGELVRQCDPVSRALNPGDCTDGAGGTATRMTYDKLGRITQRKERDLISDWFYDTVDGTPTGASCGPSKGKLCKVTADNTFVRNHTYDSLGRPATATFTIGNIYTVTTAYDSNGRVSTLTYPSGGAARNIYNSLGYLLEVRDNGDNALLWQAQTVSASGKVTQELLGNGLTTSRTYDVLDRFVGVVSSGAGGTVQNSTYTYDTLGNLTQRVDGTQGTLTENFTYDRLNRLLQSSGAGLTTRSYEYNAIGNITNKSDVGAYNYPAVGAARPHAASSVTGTVNGVTNPSFTYDANGNLTESAGRTLTYMSYNMPRTVAQGSNSFLYYYSPEHERVYLEVTRPTGMTATTYVHPNGGGELLFEQDLRPDSTFEYRHYVNGGSGLIGVFVTQSDHGMRYFHRDHLGSVQVITNTSGAVIERFGYEAFGKRRFPNGTDDPNNSIFGVTTDRGFTTHEHLDELALIHMNGRVYDPVLGRFMTADPSIPYPRNLQSYNRYSYARNNPLRHVDDDGFADESLSDFGGFGDDCVSCGKTFELTNLNSGEKLTVTVPLAFNEWGAQNWLNNQQFNFNAVTQTSDSSPAALVTGLGNEMFRNTIGAINDLNTGVQQGNLRQNLLGLGKVSGNSTIDGVELAAFGLGGKIYNFTRYDINNPSQRAGAAFGELASAVVVPIAAIRFVRASLRFGAAVEGAEAASAAGGGTTRVGRWMSRQEFDQMSATSRVVEGGGGRTYVISPPNPASYTSARPGSVFAEFDVPSSALRGPTSRPDWFVIPGPNVTTRIFGPAPAQMPPATCIVCVIGPKL